MSRKGVFRDQISGDFDDGAPIAVFPGAVASVFGRTGAVAALAGDYFGAMPAALTGATQAARFVGATTSGAPVSGTFAVGDVVVARDGHVFVCTTAGSPGTFTDVGGGASVSYATPSIVLGSSAAAGAASTVIRSDSTIAAFDATAPTTQAFGDSAAAGSAAFAARRDHTHGMPATPVTTINKTGSTALTGAVTLTGGTGVTLTQSSQDISIAATGASGLAHSYLGTNSIGGNTEAITAFRAYIKKITPGADGMLCGVSFYLDTPANGGTPRIQGLVMSDVAGTPTVGLAIGAGGTFVSKSGTGARWINVPLSMYLTNGTAYWIGVQIEANFGNMVYATSGSDDNVNYGGMFSGDNFTAASTTTRNYSIRADFLS